MTATSPTEDVRRVDARPAFHLHRSKDRSPMPTNAATTTLINALTNLCQQRTSDTDITAACLRGDPVWAAHHGGHNDALDQVQQLLDEYRRQTSSPGDGPQGVVDTTTKEQP